MTEPDGTSDKRRFANGGATVASLAAIASVIAASSCCLPILPFLMAAGLAGGSTFLSAMHPYLLAASALFIAYGFYQVRRANKCQRRPRGATTLVLWLSTLFVLISIFFPQALANAAANLLAR